MDRNALSCVWMEVMGSLIELADAQAIRIQGRRPLARGVN
jgi:hypothetical protein